MELEVLQEISEKIEVLVFVLSVLIGLLLVHIFATVWSGSDG